MRVGYARVSRQDQKLEPQRDALLAEMEDDGDLAARVRNWLALFGR